MMKLLKLILLIQLIRQIVATVIQLMTLLMRMIGMLTHLMESQVNVHNRQIQTSGMIATPNHLITTDHTQDQHQFQMQMISQTQREKNTIMKMTESSIPKSSQPMTKENPYSQRTHG